jgi:hypothetical protein
MNLVTITPVYYPNWIGNRQVFVGVGNGPTLYDAVNGDALSVSFTPFFIDSVLGAPVISLSGNYVVIPKSVTLGKGSTWVLYWYAFNKATGALSAASGNLSAEQVQLSVLGGP